MRIPSEFDDIRPFEPEELPEVFDRLLSNEQFQTILKYFFPQIPFEKLVQIIKSCKTNDEFQVAISYPFLANLIAKHSKGCDIEMKNLDRSRPCTFFSNHRDIVLDSAFLNKLLIDAKFSSTCEIAIGDNLLKLPWIVDLVRVNKSFIVRRNLPPRDQLRSSVQLARYMHFAIAEKHESLWIAQREGRAKDSDDRTQKSVLKMLALGGEGSEVERLIQLHITPLTISYEYDPCDYLKAQELQLKRDNEGWMKAERDDLISMQTGILGYKGFIHYHPAPSIDAWLEQLPANLPKNDLFEQTAQHIDEVIHHHYRLYAGNYAALDLLEGSKQYAQYYTVEEKETFEKYLEGQLAKINILDKDDAFLRHQILTMYANPVINYLKTV